MGDRVFDVQTVDAPFRADCDRLKSIAAVVEELLLADIEGMSAEERDLLLVGDGEQEGTQ